MIEIKSASVIYPSGNIGISDISFNLKPGEAKALIGKTGSGKSTLITSINGILKLSSGDIKVDNLSVNDKKNLKDIRRKATLLMQYPEYQLFADTVYEDIAFQPKNFGFNDDEIETMVNEAVAKVGLSKEYLSRSPFSLSGGEKRKVALAGVICVKPEYILLDEPTAGLDPEARKAFLEIFATLKSEGTGILMISHIPEEVCALSDSVAVLSKGKLIREDKPMKIFTDREFLRKLELIPPAITDFMLDYKETGKNVSAEVFTPLDALKEIENA